MQATRVLVGLMLVAVTIPLVPGATAHAGCPGTALACCTVGVTCNAVGGCSLGTTKAVHAHAGVLGAVASISMECVFDGISLSAVSCSGTDECATAGATAIGGNMRCVKNSPGGSGYCAIFP